MSGYDKWIKKNTHLLTNQLAIVIGATGSIGKEIVDYLLMLKAKVIIGARNLDKAEALKNQLLLKYPDAKIYIEHIDISYRHRQALQPLSSSVPLLAPPLP